MPTIDEVITEFRDGELRNGDALKDAWDYRQTLYGDQEQFLKANPEETRDEWLAREKITLNITHAIVEQLSGLYEREPTREFAEDPLENGENWVNWILDVYEDNMADQIFQEVDALTRLQGICGVEVWWDALQQRTRLRVHPRDNVEVWTADGRPDEAEIVAVLGWSGEKDRTKPDWVRLWDATSVVLLERAGEFGNLVETQREPNPLGELPFVFFHKRMITDNFYTPGIGSSVCPQNWHINKLLTELADTQIRRGFPQRWIKNAPDNYRAHEGRSRWIRIEGDGEVGQLSPDLPIAETWDSIEARIIWLMGINGVPENTVRLKASATSGVQVVAEQAPLLAARRRRAKIFRQPESLIADKIALVGAILGDAPAMPVDLGFQISYQVEAPPLPGPERLAEWGWLLEKKLASVVDIYMIIHPGADREDAEEALRQVQADAEEFQSNPLADLLPVGGFGGGNETDDEAAEDEE